MNWQEKLRNDLYFNIKKASPEQIYEKGWLDGYRHAQYVLQQETKQETNNDTRTNQTPSIPSSSER